MLTASGEFFSKYNKDEFYAKLVGEFQDVNSK
jgi:hypothetical protein